MPKIRLIIIDDNPQMCDALGDLFSANDAFDVCAKVNDAEQALEYFRNNEPPDVALIDMVMPACDGIELVMRLGSEGLSAHTLLIGMSGLISDAAMKLVQAQGIAYIIALPSNPQSIYTRVCALLKAGMSDEDIKHYRLNTDAQRIKDEAITRYLLAMGMSAHHDGFKYLREAVSMLVDSNDRSVNLTTFLYPAVGKHFGVSRKVVERSIRYAIETAWLRGNVDTQHRLFGYTVKEDKGRPTNKECISLIAERTRIRLAACSRANNVYVDQI